jgi:hypothetical protein
MSNEIEQFALQWLPQPYDRMLHDLLVDDETTSGIEAAPFVVPKHSETSKLAVGLGKKKKPHWKTASADGDRRPSITDSSRKVGTSNAFRKQFVGVKGKVNESILDSIENQLASEHFLLGDHLDEDQIVRHMLRMNRHATQQARHHSLLMFDEDLDGGSPVDSTSSVYLSFLAQEERHTSGQVFFRSIVNQLQQPPASFDAAPNEQVVIGSNETASDFANKQATLDWLRRSMGLHRHYTYAQPQPTSAGLPLPHGDPQDIRTGDMKHSDEKGPRSANARRLTRGMIQSTNSQRREKDLRVLLDAVDSLQTDLGPAFARRRAAAPVLSTSVPIRPKRRSAGKRTSRDVASSVDVSGSVRLSQIMCLVSRIFLPKR